MVPGMCRTHLIKRQTCDLWGKSRYRPTTAIPVLYRQPKQYVRQYAQPARLSIPTKAAFKPPPPPKSTQPVTIEEGHDPGEAETALGPFDDFLAKTAQALKSEHATPVAQLYAQYQERSGRMCNYVVPYDERPPKDKRADERPEDGSVAGDGVVMVIHALFKSNGKLDKVCACSGFVVDAQPLERGKQSGEIVITCAHTLEDMYRNIQRLGKDEKRVSMSYIVPSRGNPRRVQQILSSMPRSDTIAMQIEPAAADAPRLKALPVSPFPVYNGMAVLTHLFGAPGVPDVVRSQSRLPPSAKSDQSDTKDVEAPIPWLDEKAWRRWGAGYMLGYRSYTNIEVEAGIHSSLPHILTSILPSPGSSGGPLVSSETGAVVGMISGRRMDNRVEGERGWGASSESIFEMFSLPGFMPTGAKGQ